MLLQEAVTAGAHPLSGTAASYLWLLPLLPLLGFVLNGLLSLIPAYHAGPADPQASHDDHAGPPERLFVGRRSGVSGVEHRKHHFSDGVDVFGPAVDHPEQNLPQARVCLPILSQELAHIAIEREAPCQRFE